MQISTSLKQLSFGVPLALAALLFVGCESAKEKPATATTSSPPAAPRASVAAPATPRSAAVPATPTTPAVPATPSAPAVPATPSSTKPSAQAPPVRIKAGYFSSFKDSEGNTWLPDQAFTGGDTIERPDLEI